MRGLLAREEGAGAAAADRDLVGDQMHLVAVAQLAHRAQVGRVVHRHAGGALHQRLDDERGDRVVPRSRQRLQLGRGAARDVRRGFAGCAPGARRATSPVRAACSSGA